MFPWPTSASVVTGRSVASLRIVSTPVTGPSTSGTIETWRLRLSNTGISNEVGETCHSEPDTLTSEMVSEADPELRISSAMSRP